MRWRDLSNKHLEGQKMNKEDLYPARFLHNFLIGIVSGEVLSLVFGTVNPQFGFRFALLYCLIISPYLLYLYMIKRGMPLLKSMAGGKEGELH